MVGIGRKALEEGWDALPKIREGLGGPGEVESPFLRPGGVRRSYWRAGRGLEALPLGQEGYGSPLGGLGMVGRPSQRAGRSREALPEGWEGSGVPLSVLGVPPGVPGGSGGLPAGPAVSGGS